MSAKAKEDRQVLTSGGAHKPMGMVLYAGPPDKANTADQHAGAKDEHSLWHKCKASYGNALMRLIQRSPLSGA
jgi:hypothetical protein